ncbi:MAG: SpaH/EbpB family LPXTG-anchored major pilin [Carnobacterium sp.]|uniref:SpaH/EbpB family LPXTG-anchored major pilin n=1 Tax=Carnobacterium sp. TaxID=48221 RepID=UPI002FC69BA6
MKTRGKLIKALTALLCVLPIMLGVLGISESASAAGATVDVTLHKKKMDEFPTKEIQNTGEEMSEFDHYKGLSGVEFTAWDITTDFYKKLDIELAKLPGNYSDEAYDAAVKKVKQEFKLVDAKDAVSKGTQTTDTEGLATFMDLEERDAGGIYKVYLFDEAEKEGVTAGAYPLILILPALKEDGTPIRDIHLYPKNKVKPDDIDKEIVDENGKPITTPTEGRYDYEVGKKIYYRATFTIPSQIGDELIGEDGSKQTRYSKLNFTDAVDKTGVKFEGISKITADDQEIDLTEFQKHGTITLKNTDSNYDKDQFAGFEIVMNLNNATNKKDDTNYQISRATADYLKDYAGQKLAIYYVVSLTDDTPVDESVENSFTVDLNHDNSQEDEVQTVVDPPVVTTGGRKFIKVDSKEPDQGLAGAGFVVIKTEGSEEYFLKVEANTRTWVKVVGDDYTDAKLFTSKNDGTFEVTGLAYGDYSLREINAPNGYSKLEDDFDFTISKDSYTDDAAQLKIANVTKGGFLPSTGGTGIIAFLIVGIGLMTYAYIRYRKLNQGV